MRTSRARGGVSAGCGAPGYCVLCGTDTVPARHLPTSPSPHLSLAQDTYTVNGETRPCPYAGRAFAVSLKFPTNYPFKHPDMRFVPGQLYHPNVNRETGA